MYQVFILWFTIIRLWNSNNIIQWLRSPQCEELYSGVKSIRKVEKHFHRVPKELSRLYYRTLELIDGVWIFILIAAWIWGAGGEQSQFVIWKNQFSPGIENGWFRSKMRSQKNSDWGYFNCPCPGDFRSRGLQDNRGRGGVAFGVCVGGRVESPHFYTRLYFPSSVQMLWSDTCALHNYFSLQLTTPRPVIQMLWELFFQARGVHHKVGEQIPSSAAGLSPTMPEEKKQKRCCASRNN